MNIVLCTREDESRTLAHGLILCTPEEAEDYLMHYRTKGSKNGERRWQDENGRLTPAGYEHYAEMYGWNRRLKKARKLDNKADKARGEIDRASGKADKALLDLNDKQSKKEQLDVDADRARQLANDKNELSEKALSKYDPSKTGLVAGYRKHKMNSTSKAAEKATKNAEKANAEANKQQELVNESMTKLDAANREVEAAKAKARIADSEAAKYADKLQRKEDRMSRYMNEDGTLNEEGINKYTYATPNPGEKKMSLLGRIKFGNHYADKFDNENKMKMTKEEYDKWEAEENEKFEKGTELHDRASNFDKLSPEDKRKYGDEILSYCKEKGEEFMNIYNPDGKWNSKAFDKLKDTYEYTTFNDLQSWVMDRVYNKSGSWNAGEYKKGSNAEKASHEYNRVSDEISKVYDKVSKETGYTIGKNYDKLIKAVKQTDEWPALDNAYKKAEGDLLGAMLKDIGFSDTPENRSMLMQYAFLD